MISFTVCTQFPAIQNDQNISKYLTLIVSTLIYPSISSDCHFLVGRCSVSGDGKGQLLIKDEERSDYIILSEEVMVSFSGETCPLKLSHGEFELLILWVTRPFP